ncbi:diacylglycerol kinase-like protein [Leishmania mexicana MHOM/GT/2001/U1103]|uniref:Diacylglycerol kinase n=1 Tax=Leishmania mexicana (strain MHOM/GT/2001/U1103) TaxID=929439 RepID=E9B763_LEIMU|nr:diacylglycerol kinase-like protein [Leishmania mexicana MHOM/GT/2001/U1103]CBZ31086.1 diacylglycerol kinase-like protein [Leishmania mexicana MHOM/GT/2001/U1103]
MTSLSHSPRIRDCARTFFALVNLRSGGRRSSEYVLHKLRDTLGADRVWVLFEGGTAERHRSELELFLRKQAPEYVIVAGGDGTISFAMDVIKRLHDQNLLSPNRGVIAPFPLGTGNDFSFTLGFGSGFARWIVLGEKRFQRLMRDYETATVTNVDRWSLHVTTTTPRHPSGLVHTHVFNNYFSIGFDAAVASRLNRFRRRHPYLFTTRPVVKLWYAAFAVMALFAEKKIGSSILLEVDGCCVPVPASAKSIAVCNMLTYAGGSVAWNGDAVDHYAKPSVWDGRVEIVCFYGIWHLALVRLGWCYGKKLGQGTTVCIETDCHSCQFDGEEVLDVADTKGKSTFRIAYFSTSECLTVPPRQETNIFVLLLALAAIVVGIMGILYRSPVS